MTNKERYKQAFSPLHVSESFAWEAKDMKKTHSMKRIMILAAAIALLAVSATAAYAADVGGIQRTLQIWVHGEQTDATLTFDGSGGYFMSYTDANGETQEQSGGGVALEPFGKERPLTEDELIAELTMPDVRYEDDGSVWVYWLDQAVEITDKFENGVCYVKLTSGDETQYITIKYDNGFATNPHKYRDPKSFN